MNGFAWVTLATNDSYSLGALTLAHSLRRVGTLHDLVVLITQSVTAAMRVKLAEVFNHVQEVNVLDSNDESNLALLARPDLGITFTKLHCWTLTNYAKCVFLDADTFVLQQCDELFERDELSAAPDVGWPDCFNSGVFVYRPSMETFRKLVDFALTQGSFDGGDQGLLNLYFSDWSLQSSARRLPFIYNMCSTACYSYLPAFKEYGSNAKIVHFIGPSKPWLLEIDSQTGIVNPNGAEYLRPIFQLWWEVFLAEVVPKLHSDMGGMAGALAQLTIGSPRTEQQAALEQHWRREAWEHGRIDYLGKDAFDKIWAKILSTITATQPTVSVEDSSQGSVSDAPIAESLQALSLAVEDQSAVQTSSDDLQAYVAPDQVKSLPTSLEPPVSESVVPVILPLETSSLQEVLDSLPPIDIPILPSEVEVPVNDVLSAPASPEVETLPNEPIVPSVVEVPPNDIVPTLAPSEVDVLPDTPNILSPIVEIPPNDVVPTLTPSEVEAVLSEPIVPSSVVEVPPSDIVLTLAPSEVDVCPDPPNILSPVVEVPPNDVVPTLIPSEVEAVLSEPIVLSSVVEVPPSDIVLTLAPSEVDVLPDPPNILSPEVDKLAITKVEALLTDTPDPSPTPLVEDRPEPISPPPQQVLELEASPLPPSPVLQAIPHTPTITDATPPTSPPIEALSDIPRTLAVGTVTPLDGATQKSEGAASQTGPENALPKLDQ